MAYGGGELELEGEVLDVHLNDTVVSTPIGPMVVTPTRCTIRMYFYGKAATM